jgi:hypothetical protein
MSELRDPHYTLMSIIMQAGVPAIYWGPPGIGKTAITTAITKALDYHLETVMVSIRTPEDFLGIPIKDFNETLQRSVTDYAPPSWAIRVCEQAAKGKKVVVFFDEVNQGTPPVQAALMRVVLEKVAGELQLPADQVTFIAAANPPECATAGWELAPALANRFAHFDQPFDYNRWHAHQRGASQFVMQNSIVKLPDNWEQTHLPVARQLMVGFAEARRDLVQKMPDDEAARGRAWPSTRSWEMGMRMYAACQAVGEDDLAVQALSSCVGPGPAHEFVNWAQAADLPNTEALLADPDSYQHPKRGDITYAVLAGVTSATLADLTPPRWTACWKILATAAREQAADIAGGFAMQLAQSRGTRTDLPVHAESMQQFGAILRLTQGSYTARRPQAAEAAQAAQAAPTQAARVQSGARMGP